MHYIAGFCIYNIKIFQRVIPPDPAEVSLVLGPNTPISASHASVLIVPILCNDLYSKYIFSYKSLKPSWRRGSVVRMSVCSRRTFPDLRLIHG